MNPISPDVIETAKVREVFGTLGSAGELDAAVNGLLLAGFDRADIDLMATEKAVRGKLGDRWRERPEDDRPHQAERREFVTVEDETNTTALTIGTLSYVGAIGLAALAVAASGGSLALAAAAALAGGLSGGGLGMLLVRKLGERRAKELERELAEGRLALFVRVDGPGEERRAMDVLNRHHARNVQSAEIEIDKRLADLPLAEIRPDPWLGSEPIGTAQ